MTVILLIVAAGLPVINVGIDPSSEVFAIKKTLSENMVPRLIEEIGAHQCAYQMIHGRDLPADKLKSLANEVASKFRDQLTKIIEGRLKSVSGKDYEVTKIEVKKASVVSSWDRGSKVAELKVDVRVDVTYKQKGSNRANTVSYSETFLVTSSPSKGGFYRELSPNVGIVSIIYLIVGFLPIVGPATEFLKFRNVMIGFNVGLSYFDENTKRDVKVGALAGKPYVHNHGNTRLRVIGVNRAGFKSFVYTTDPTIAAKTGEYRVWRAVEWTEWMGVDWVGVALSVIPPLKLGKFVTKLPKAMKSDEEPSDALYSSIGRSYWEIMRTQLSKTFNTAEVKPTSKAHSHDPGYYQYREKIKDPPAVPNTKGHLDDAFNAVDGETLINTMTEIVEIQAENAVTPDWLKRYREAARTYGKIFSDIDVSEESLYSSSGAGKIPVFFQRRDPLLLFSFPRPNGIKTYSGCIWLTGILQ
ncbi:MAG: hypothetical protein ABDH63_02805 [Candidatus Caldarchaeales archaeon]